MTKDDFKEAERFEKWLKGEKLDELKKEAEEYTNTHDTLVMGCEENLDCTKFMQQAYLAGAKPREKRIAELEAQIEKMKNCRNCKKFMIEGVCGHFLQVGWCKNWELRR